MTTFGKGLKKSVRRPLLAAFALTIMLTPVSAISAERDSTALFFSFEDLKQELSKPDLSQLYPSFSWQNLQEQADRQSPIERNYRWGNGLGFDSYTFPGVRRPLWGY